MTRPLTNVQREILQSFNYELSEQDLRDFRRMLADYFARKVSDDIDVLFEQRGWEEKKTEEWAATHLRTPYTDSSSADKGRRE